MEFHAGDTVMHWTYGLGQVVGQEERVFSGSKFVYYAIQRQTLLSAAPIKKQKT
jgi:RNA polymerase-interacting CarD/CdnL/TRCF family regulator